MIMINLVKEWFVGLQHFLNSFPVLLVTCFLACIFKLFVAAMLILKIKNSHNRAVLRSLILLIVMVLSASMIDFSWVIKVIKDLKIIDISYQWGLFTLRTAWGCMVLQHQTLMLFIGSLLEKNYKPKKIDYFFLAGSLCLFIFFIGIAFYDINCTSRPFIEILMQRVGIFFVLLCLLVCCLRFIIILIRNNDLPRILQRQLKTFIQFLIIPYVISECMQVYPFNFALHWVTNSYLLITLTAILLTYTIYHCLRKVMGLRFLNTKQQVMVPVLRVNLITDFKEVFEQLNLITSTKELHHVIQMFFKEAFGIPTNKTHLYIRHLDPMSKSLEINNVTKQEAIIENFIRNRADNGFFNDFLYKEKILVVDELAFTNFYEELEESKKILAFLDSIHVDIFIPIYEERTIIAYIIVERNARAHNLSDQYDFYSNIEQDQMHIFANYLSNVINILQHRNLPILTQREKELSDELFLKHQENNQYKESIRLFLHSAQEERKIGIIFYKNRQFSFGNQAAQEMIGFNINTHQGHPITKQIRTLAHKVIEYASPQILCTHDIHGKKIVLSGLLSLEHHNVIITCYYPDISDLIKNKIDLLKDPTRWDYLLYLETTQSGKRISQLIPGSGPTLLNFKIELLKVALHKKALLLTMPSEDLHSVVEIIQHISLRDQLHVVSLSHSTKDSDIAIKLFGMKPLFDDEFYTGMSLFEKLNNSGVLLLENIQYLSLELQEQLAEFMKYGTYRLYQSDQKAMSNVRIICSTVLNLELLVQDGKFSSVLYEELKSTRLVMPSLLGLPESELLELVTELTEQAITSDAFKNLLELSDKDRRKLIDDRATSIHELRTKIHNLLVTKSKKHHIYQDVEFNSSYEGTDQVLINASRLGKHALKDPRIMSELWLKFGNQNKIATFLGVNRSSVNRRCKEYGIL